MKVTYLGHSGFTVDTGAHFLIFDYYMDTPLHAGLEGGVIDPHALSERDVTVFVSHRHGDHYNRKIFFWGKQIKKLRLILSDDIWAKEPCTKIGPNQTLTLPDMTISTYRSTDEGVAFLVRVDGKLLYHAGDLNWWHWEGETAAYNEKMKQDYLLQLEKLKQDLQGQTPDVAFLALDGRLEEGYRLGMDAFMKQVGAKTAVPMHLWEQFGLIDRMKKEPCAQDYADRIWRYDHRGQQIELV